MSSYNVTLFTADLFSLKELDPNKISPGVGGFVATAALALLVLVLGMLMVRTIRRINYRAQVQEEIAREKAAQTLQNGAGALPAAKERNDGQRSE